MNSATDDGVPGAVVAAEQLIEVLVLENVRIAESGDVQRVGATGSSRDHRTLLEFSKITAAVSRDSKTLRLGTLGVGERPVDWQIRNGGV